MTVDNKIFIMLIAMNLGMMIQWHAKFTKGLPTGWDIVTIILISLPISYYAYK